MPVIPGVNAPWKSGPFGNSRCPSSHAFCSAWSFVCHFDPLIMIVLELLLSQLIFGLILFEPRLMDRAGLLIHRLLVLHLHVLELVLKVLLLRLLAALHVAPNRIGRWREERTQRIEE